MNAARPIVIAGAGSIGCFVGGMLAAAGKPVRFLARSRMIDEIRANGLRLTSFEGIDRRLPGSSIELSDDPARLREAGIVLVCVKSADTAAMAATIAAYAPSDAIVVSLQNGVSNVATLQTHLAGHRIVAGMVPFNVVALGNGRFHRSTSGDIVVQADDTALAARLSVPGLMLRPTDDIVAVQWGKLLVNLNNAINALSGLPLRDQLSQRPWRRLLADQIDEALRATAAEGIAPVAPTPLPAAWTPRILRLPDWAFRLVAGRMIKIDPRARSSMADDLDRGRVTEIDYLQGVIVEIARRRHLDVPLTRGIVELIKHAERLGQGSPRLNPDQIRAGAV
ncbi:MAG: 2-dehydropantoate 2-reductase [Xanthobacteraceae bacterium]|nr:2-dehydropantoate 2-reductase [Xanthobacteraceae bacterium]